MNFTLRSCYSTIRNWNDNCKKLSHSLTLSKSGHSTVITLRNVYTLLQKQLCDKKLRTKLLYQYYKHTVSVTILRPSSYRQYTQWHNW